MAYEAMLAGLEMTPFWGGFKNKDLEPKIGKDPMTRIYKLLEYIPIKWEAHSESHPPIVTSDETPWLRDFKQSVVSLPLVSVYVNQAQSAFHHQQPRQIFNHQRLHASVCMHYNSSLDPFAYLPDSWTGQPGALPGVKYGWKNIINQLRAQDEAARAIIKKPTSPLPSLTSINKIHFRGIVRSASSRSSASSQQQSQGQGTPGRQSPDHQSLQDPESSEGGMSDQPEVAPRTVYPPGHSPVSSPVPSRVPLPVASSTALPVSSPIPLSNLDSEFRLRPEVIEWDLLDHSAIPTLIDGVLRGTNANEFLKRLEVLSYSGRRSFIAVIFFLHEIFQTLARRRFKRAMETSLLQWFDKYVAMKSTPSILGWPFR